jgi:hypothetical protein
MVTPSPADAIIRKVQEMRAAIDAGDGIVQIQAAPRNGKIAVTVRVKPARL